MAWAPVSRSVTANMLISLSPSGGDDSAVLAEAVNDAASDGAAVLLQGSGPYHANVTVPSGVAIFGEGGTEIQQTTAASPVLSVASDFYCESLKFASCQTGIAVAGASTTVGVTVNSCQFASCVEGIANRGAGLIDLLVEKSKFSNCRKGFVSDSNKWMNNSVFRRCWFELPPDYDDSYQISIAGDESRITTEIEFDHCTFEGNQNTKGRSVLLGSGLPNYMGVIGFRFCHWADWRTALATGREIITNLAAMRVSFENCDGANASGNFIYCNANAGPKFLAFINSNFSCLRSGSGDLPFVKAADAQPISGVVGLGSTFNVADDVEMDFGAVSSASFIACTGAVPRNTTKRAWGLVPVSVSESTEISPSNGVGMLYLATGDITLTLPYALYAGALGVPVTVKNVGSGTVTVATKDSVDTLDGSGSSTTLSAGQSKQFITATLGNPPSTPGDWATI